MKVKEYFVSDVLVIGGDVSGCRAALEANECASSVIIVDQDIVGSGEPRLQESDILYTAPVPTQADEDSWQTYVDDCLCYGDHMGSRELLSILAKHSLQGAWEVGRFGFSWAREAGRQFRLLDVEGHRFPRGLAAVEDEPSMAQVLGDHLRSRVGVQVLDNIYITGLLQHKGRAVGAVGIDAANDAIVVLTAGSTVITAGGMEGLFRYRRGSGSGLAMAYRLGAALIAPELIEVSATNENGNFRCMGGLQIDSPARTTIPELYAAGGIVGGIFGARALPGSRQAANVVFGALAGRSAGLMKTPIPRIKEEGVKEEMIRLQRFLRRIGRSRAVTHTLDEFCDELNLLARNGLGPDGSRDALNKILTFLEDYDKDWYVKVRPSSGEVSLSALIDWIEVDYLLTMIGLAAEATRMRFDAISANDQITGSAQSTIWESNIIVSRESGNDKFEFITMQRQETETMFT